MDETGASLLIDRLERFGAALPAVVACVDAEAARWKPPGGAWSVLEIVGHLADEEVEDFGTRVFLTLRDPGTPWPPIDPEGWSGARGYNAQDLVEQVGRFVTARRESVARLRALSDPDWSRAHAHPRGWTITAGDLLTSWAAHDALHLRQIAKRLYELAQRDGGGCRTEYAGEWRA